MILKNILPYVPLKDLQTTFMLIVNALSPKITDDLWHDVMVENLGEDSLALIADKAIGSDYLRSHDPQYKDETPEDMFDQISNLGFWRSPVMAFH